MFFLIEPGEITPFSSLIDFGEDLMWLVEFWVGSMTFCHKLANNCEGYCQGYVRKASVITQDRGLSKRTSEQATV